MSTYKVSVKKVHVKKMGKQGGFTDTYISVKTPDGTINLSTNLQKGVSTYSPPGAKKSVKVPELAGQRRIAAGFLEREGKKGTVEHYKMPLVKRDMVAIAKALRSSYEPQSLFRAKRKRKATA